MRLVYSLLLILLLPALSAAGDTLPNPRWLSDHAWTWIGPYGPPTRENAGFRMNMGIVVGDEAVAVIDSGCGEAMAKTMLAQIRAVTDPPSSMSSTPIPSRTESWVIRCSVAPGAEVIVAGGAVPRITGQGADFAATVAMPAAPDRALEQETTLDLGGIVLRLIPVGQAHTAGSVIAVVESDRVVFAGDVLYGGRLLAVLPQSRVTSWIDAYEKLRDFGEFRLCRGTESPGCSPIFYIPLSHT